MPRIRSLCLVLLALVSALLAPLAAAQESPAPELKTVANTPLRYVVQVPPGHAADKWAPMLVVLTGGRGEDEARVAIAAVAGVVAAGFVAVAPVLDEPQAVPDLRPLFAELRRAFRIDQGGMHGLVRGAANAQLLRVHRHEFQTVSWTGALADDEVAALKQLPACRVGSASPGRIVEHFTDLHRQRALSGVAGDVARVLDDFHDAAANADEDRYFAILPDDAVFLGTDGTERWTGAQFKLDYMKYFQRASAWTYVARRREVSVEPGDTTAWFDETLCNEAYGECRGSGVMAKRDGKWVLRQYNLTMCVPNDVAHGVAARIRAFQDKVPAVTTIVLVRHAEKADDSEDPDLSDAGKRRAEALAQALRDVPLTTAYTSQYRRTAATLRPLELSRMLSPSRVVAKDATGLAARIRANDAGKTVLVCGHSTTIPAILKALGVDEAVTIDDGEYDRMFVVTLAPEGAHMLSLRYGP